MIYLLLVMTLSLLLSKCYDSYNIKHIYAKTKKLQMMNDDINRLSSLSDSVRNNWIRKSSVLIGTAMLSGFTLSRNAYGSAAPAYLKDPTSEFKDEEKKFMEFSKEQQKIRKNWDAIIEKLEASESPEVTESIIKEMTAFLVKIKGIPTGVKKLDIVKICRKKKFNGRKIKPTWTVPVEIAYEAFIQEFNRQVLPNNKSDRI